MQCKKLYFYISQE